MNPKEKQSRGNYVVMIQQLTDPPLAAAVMSLLVSRMIFISQTFDFWALMPNNSTFFSFLFVNWGVVFFCISQSFKSSQVFFCAGVLIEHCWDPHPWGPWFVLGCIHT